ncbi:MAG: hydantoinase/oxoprolinase family protein [Proteobacteria bacterium]|nr:hydantoinase/oxoprolinase family protein [Pseudomonadota bacterium]
MAAGATHSIGIDIGGTFTDIVLLGPSGPIRTHKISSTADDFSRGIVTGVRELLDAAGLVPGAVAELVHATTVATNAILEQKGAPTALITTAGFRDVLEMRRLRIPVLYDLQYDKPAPLVPRRLRFEVRERMGPRGEIRIPLDEASVEAAAKQLQAAGVEAVAICLLHSYANPTHERRVADIVRRLVGDDLYITCSADILPEIREYERTSTAVVNSYVGPVVRRYLRSLANRLAQANLDAPIRIMQSNGGVMTAGSAGDKPACIVESGPAAGVIACARLARHLGHGNIISFDMGGTTAKAAIIENGEPAKTTEYEVGAGINLSSKLVKGGGYAIKLPFIDVSEIGAGGGSIVAVDSAGALKVGPRSAGAMPGPVCYDIGGTEPTFTDAMVALGYVNPDYLVGGTVRLNADKARRVLADRIARPLNLSLLDAAHGIYTIAAATMTRAVKAVSTYRGRDPRDFALVAFGGNGPVAGVEVARALKMKRVLVPPAPGVFSAVGLLFSDIEHEFLRTFFRRTDELRAQDVAAAFQQLEVEARRTLRREGHATEQIELRWLADLRYSGQAYELTVAMPRNGLDFDEMHRAFHGEHERTYGHRSDGDPVDLVNVKVLARVVRLAAQPYEGLAAEPAGPQQDEIRPRDAYFGAEHGTIATPLLRRRDLAAAPIQGPAIVEEYDATCVIPPGCLASLDRLGNINIELD